MKQIPLFRMVVGNRRYPNTLKFKIVAHALVDDRHYSELNRYRWGLSDGRAYRCEGNPTRTIFMHQMVCGYKFPDHIDRNPLNNQEYNLRPASCSQNAMNTKKRKGTSRFRDVF